MLMRFLAVAIIIVLGLIGWRFYEGYTAYDTLAEAPHNQYVGSDNPALIITEIMDYRCPYCRILHDNMTAFVALHPEVRVVYRVFPIFQEPSSREAKIAMAAGMQGKFEEMHNKLIRLDNPLTPDELDQIIAELGLNREKMQTDIKSWSVTKDLLDTIGAVNALGIRSTPTLVVNGEIFTLNTGMTTVEDLEVMLAKHLKAAVPDVPQP